MSTNPSGTQFQTNKASQTTNPQYRQLSAPESGAEIPKGLLDAIYPGRRSSQTQVPATDHANSRVASSIQDDQIQRTAHLSSVEPNRINMASEFSKLPKPIDNKTNGTGDGDKEKTLAMLMQSSSSMDFASGDSNSDDNMTESDLRSMFQRSEAESKTNSPKKFQETLQRIATSTCLVLILGVAFILVAKKVMGGTTTTKATQTTEQQIRIVNSLRLNPKSNLHLVEVGSQRVLVACDLNGIKSVVSLSHSFEDTLEEYREESPESAMGSADSTDQKSTKEIEAEMQEKLSQILGGEAFKDVFYRDRAVA